MKLQNKFAPKLVNRSVLLSTKKSVHQALNKIAELFKTENALQTLRASVH